MIAALFGSLMSFFVFLVKVLISTLGEMLVWRIWMFYHWQSRILHSVASYILNAAILTFNNDFDSLAIGP